MALTFRFPVGTAVVFSTETAYDCRCDGRKGKPAVEDAPHYTLRCEEHCGADSARTPPHRPPVPPLPHRFTLSTLRHPLWEMAVNMACL
ncbi:unnamed protein product, partial [Iphiclides podalirius]